MPSSQPDMERLFVELPADLKRGLEALALEYRRQRRPDQRTVAAIVRCACDELLWRELPGYVSPLGQPGPTDSEQ
jgi:hypothetical protein